MTTVFFILKSLHIVGFVAWFAGLFYLVRIFVYHAEALDMDGPKKDILTQQYHLMEERVYHIICNPAMIITWVCGTIMICIYGWEWFVASYWLHAKIFLLILLTGYHHRNKSIIKKLAAGEKVMSSEKFRMYNEVPTLFLLTIVLLAVFKNNLNFVYALGAILLVGVLLMIAIKQYKKYRLNNKNK